MDRAGGGEREPREGYEAVGGGENGGERRARFSIEAARGQSVKKERA